MNDLENNISNISNNHYHYLMSLKNVNGVGLSYKYINGKNTFEPCLCVLVENKVNNKFLTVNNVIPKSYMGIKTDVIAIGKTSLNTSSVIFFKMRPLKGGTQIGPVDRDIFGTICCIVKKTIRKGILKKPHYYILSNNHVLANNNEYPIGTFFMQPSRSDGNVHTDMVAALTNFVRITFLEDDSESENLLDAAIAEIFNLKIISNEIYSQGRLKGTTDPALLLNVKKVGAKTGLTSGHIITINSSVKISTKDARSAIFKDQIISDLKTSPGDSGSAVITIDNKIVGMHMASGGDGFSIANNINIALKKLDVELYTG